MCIITASELKQNLGKYLERSATEDVVITKNGKIVSVLTAPTVRSSALDALHSISAKYPYFDYEKLLDEREDDR